MQTVETIDRIVGAFEGEDEVGTPALPGALVLAPVGLAALVRRR